MLRVTLKNLAAKKLRLALTSIAVVLGVAFMAGTFVLTDTLGHVFDDLFATTTKGVDAVVRAREPFKAASAPGGGPSTDTRPPVPDSLVGELAGLPEVARAQGTLSGYALVVGKDGKAVQHSRGAPTLAVPWHSGRDGVNQSLRIVHGKGAAPRRPDEVALDLQTFEDGGFHVGDRVTVIFLGTAPREFTISGAFLFGGEKNALAGATLTAFTPTVAQEVTGLVGQWSQVDFAAKPGVSQTELRDALRQELKRDGQSASYEAITGTALAKEESNTIKDNLSFFNTFLLIFALVALFVGAFIIYNTFSITVAQRTRELGLLRALGATGRQVVISVALEALAVGLFASTVGLGVGIAIVRPLEAVLSAFGIDLPTGSMQILPRTIIVSILAGTIVTFVSALAPARRSARVPPIAALREQATSPSSGRRRYVWGGVATGFGLVALGLGLFGNLGNAALTVGLAAALVFVGVGMLSPLVAGPIATVLTLPSVRRHRITGLLARENAKRNPRRTASTAAALMIGLALVTLIAIFGASAKASFAAAIDDQTHADFVISSETFQGFSPEVATAIRQRLVGSTVVELRTGSVKLADQPITITGASGNIARAFDIKLRRGTRADAFDTEGGVYLYKDVAAAQHLRVGDTVPGVVFPKGKRDLVVQGIYDDKQVLQVDALVSLADWNLFDQATDQLAIVLKPAGTSSAEARIVVKQVVDRFPGVRAEDKTEFKNSQLAQLDQILGLMYVLLFLAVVIALIGIVNTLALSVFERTREIGLLRAVGMTRAQTARMIRGEALIVSVFGALLGLVIGVVFGAALVQALSGDGISLSIPPGQLAIFLVLAGILGIIAGWWPARHAAHLDVLEAINTE